MSMQKTAHVSNLEHALFVSFAPSFLNSVHGENSARYFSDAGLDHDFRPPVFLHQFFDISCDAIPNKKTNKMPNPAPTDDADSWSGERPSDASFSSLRSSFRADDASFTSFRTRSLSSGTLGGTNSSDKTSDKSYRVRSDYIEPVVAEEEQKSVNRAKVLVASVLLLAVLGASISVFLLVRREETKDFHVQFENYVAQVIAVAKQNTRSSFEAIETFAVTASSFAEETDKKWPFVLLPDFAARAERLSKLSGAYTLALVPIVETQEQRYMWYEFNQANRLTMLKEDVEYMGLNTTGEIMNSMCSPVIFTVNVTTGQPGLETRPGPWYPISQGYPLDPNSPPLLNYNIATGERINASVQTAIATQAPALNFVLVSTNLELDLNEMEVDSYNRQHYKAESSIMQPVFQRVNSKGDKKVVAILFLIVNWISYFQNVLPQGANGVVVVLKSSCTDFELNMDALTGEVGIDSITYEINGLDAVFLGEGDQHDPAYDDFEISDTFINIDIDYDNVPEGVCAPELTIHLYPSKTLEDSFRTSNATLFTIVVVVIFAFTSLVFVIFDLTVRRRQDKVMARVIRQDKIVSNMFPTQFRDRLYDTGSDDLGKEKSETVGSDDLFGTTPLAELYLDVSVIFADISGFTAWASTREPSQVFQLLESIYTSFDKTAYRRNVFKVETVGDCYVACVGLPEPRSDHIVAAAKFARDILHDMDGLTHKLEVTMGPDTTDLKLRVGIHSGQVTAGVLRGDKSRFQLFGDTVNTASRMESTSKQNRIQLSFASSEKLRKSGYSRWITPRKDKVAVKGKGDMQTCWLRTKAEMRSSKGKGGEKLVEKSKHNESHESLELLPGISEQSDETDVDDDDGEYEFFESLTKTERLVKWNVEILSPLLQQVLASRGGDSSPSTSDSLRTFESKIGKEGTVLEQFKEIITLPQIGFEELKRRKEPNSVELSNVVMTQLHDLLLEIAALYRDNPFHNFEHASHVTASVQKLLSRIVKVNSATEDLVGHSYGITSDPLTQFAVVFSAFIHDVDHPGVPNAQLVKEKTKNAIYYKEKSVAEQNSVDLAWNILMHKKYADLRACIYSNEKELQQFRQLVVNVVMATDICDKELGNLRKARWAVAFSGEDVLSTPEEDTNRKATIVLEHLIQASDVAHTMQHWHVFRLWNEKLFKEMYAAYRAGRADKDPSIGWYESEIGFFDFYIIPLAKKLDSCGVFGISSHEYLNYATNNREEWVRRGRDMVKEYVENFQREDIS